MKICIEFTIWEPILLSVSDIFKMYSIQYPEVKPLEMPI